MVHELPDGVERHLNRVELGRVGWEVSEVDAPPLGRLGDGRDALIPQNTSSAMDGCVVEDEIAPGGHTRQELLKALSGDSSLEKAPGHVPAVPDAQQERVGPDTIARSPGHSSGTSRAPGVVLVVVEEEGTLVEGECLRAEHGRYGSRELCTPGGVCLCVRLRASLSRPLALPE